MARGDIEPKLISGSTNGKLIAVAATATPGTLIHTPGAVAPDMEYVTLYAVNINAAGATRTLTIEYGGTTAADKILVQLGPNRGLVLVVDRLPIVGAANVIRAFADVANEVNVGGRVSSIDL